MTGVTALLGLLIGPVLMLLSYSFYSTLHDFEKHGKSTSGRIVDLYDNNNPRYTSYFADVLYLRSGDTNHHREVVAKRVEVYFKAFDRLKIGDTTTVLYKPGSPDADILLGVNYAPENVPLSRKPFWGWSITIFAILVLASYRVVRYLKKQKNHEN